MLPKVSSGQKKGKTLDTHSRGKDFLDYKNIFKIQNK